MTKPKNNPLLPDGRWNASIVLDDPVVDIDFKGRVVTPHALDWAGIVLGQKAKQATLGHFVIDPRNEPNKAIYSAQVGGVLVAENVSVLPFPTGGGNALQVDAESAGILDQLTIAQFASANGWIKIARTRSANLDRVNIGPSGSYALSLAEEVGTIDIRRSEFNGFISHFPDTKKGKALIDRITIRDTDIRGKIEHIQVRDLYLEDVDFHITDKVGIVDKTPADQVGLRVFKDVHFVGGVAPFKHYGASVEPVFSNCTWNGSKL